MHDPILTKITIPKVSNLLELGYSAVVAEIAMKSPGMHFMCSDQKFKSFFFLFTTTQKNFCSDNVLLNIFLEAFSTYGFKYIWFEIVL